MKRLETWVVGLSAVLAAALLLVLPWMAVFRLLVGLFPSAAPLYLLELPPYLWFRLLSSLPRYLAFSLATAAACRRWAWRWSGSGCAGKPGAARGSTCRCWASWPCWPFPFGCATSPPPSRCRASSCARSIRRACCKAWSSRRRLRSSRARSSTSRWAGRTSRPLSTGCGAAGVTRARIGCRARRRGSMRTTCAAHRSHPLPETPSRVVREFCTRAVVRRARPVGRPAAGLSRALCDHAALPGWALGGVYRAAHVWAGGLAGDGAAGAGWG